jgi:hypothetical protein
MTLGLVAALLTGCTDKILGYLFNSYDRTTSGKLTGKLVLEWIDQDKFRFISDSADPLRFVRANNEVIKPGEMFTDGGSIPAPLRAIKSFSPWGYAPAFIIHDWLFVMKHCKISGHEKWNHLKAADVLAEVMKTVMESPRFGGPNKLVHYSMYEAVRSQIAKDYWDKGNCETSGGILRSPEGSEAAQEQAEKSAPSTTRRSAPSRSATRSLAPPPSAAGSTRMRTVITY